MAEEIDHKAITPETMKLESGDIMKNVEPQASVTSDHEAISHEDTKLETGEIMIDGGPPTSEASDSDLYAKKMEHNIVDDEETSQLEGSYDSSFKEEGESLRGKSDTKNDILEQISPTKKSDNARKKPTLIVVGSNHKFNVRSRYLSDRVDSCHDFCKFGHKHESEKETSRLSLGKIRESQPLLKTTNDDLEKCVVEKVTKKKELHRRLSVPGTLREKSPLMHVEDKNLSKDITPSKMKHVESERKPSSVQNPTTSSRSKSASQAVKKIVTQSPNLKKTPTQKLKEVKTRKEAGSISKGETEVNEVNEVNKVNEEGGCRQEAQDVNEKKAKEPVSDSPKTNLKSADSKGVKEMKAKKPMSNSPKTPLKKSPSLKARLIKNPKSFSNSRNQINRGKPKVDGHDDTIEANPNMQPTEKTPEGTINGENSKQSSRETRARKPKEVKGNVKGIGASPLSMSSRESSRPNGEKLGLKMMKNKQIVSRSEESKSKTSTPREKSTTTRRLQSLDFKSTKQNGIIKDFSRSRTSTPREKLLVEQKWKPKRKEKNNVEEKDASAWKVKFKRGTVVALQVVNNAPKRLRFRRARSLGEDQIAKAGIDQKLKNEHVMGNEGDAVGPEKVRLRHQQTSEKKDDVDLNNVIEETASKLVKTRKSKVKALVGAFETVMSLADRKRLVENGAS